MYEYAKYAFFLKNASWPEHTTQFGTGPFQFGQSPGSPSKHAVPFGVAFSKARLFKTSASGVFVPIGTTS